MGLVRATGRGYMPKQRGSYMRRGYAPPHDTHAPGAKPGFNVSGLLALSPTCGLIRRFSGDPPGGVK